MHLNKSIIYLLLCLFITMNVAAQTSNWQALGPVNFPTNISGQINGIGRVCQIKFDPANANTIYACSASGGLWKSVNAGNSWTQLGTDYLPQMNFASICIDHSNSNIIYLASGDPNYYSVDLGIWKSIDGGITWNQINTGFGNLMAVELLMDPLDNLSIVAATNNGIFKTTDGGLNWTNKLAGGQFTDVKWNPSAGSSIMYASTFNKFYRSEDRGNTWSDNTAAFSSLLDQGTRIATSAANASYVYVVSVKDEGTIFRSVDSGLTFSIQYHDPTWSLTGYDSTGGGQGNYNICLEAHPLNPNQLFLGSHNIMRSNDGGVTWQKLTKWWQTVHTDMHDYEFKPDNPNLLFQANDGGVWLTGNSGIDWEQKSDGLGATENYHAVASPLYANLVSAGTQDNGELIFIDSLWKTNRGGDWTTRMYMDYSTQKMIYYTEDKERRALPSGGSKDYNLATSIAASSLKHVFSPDNAELGYVSGTSIWQTKNLSDASPVWSLIVNAGTTIRAMGICPKHTNIFAYCTNNKFFITHDALNTTPSFASSTFASSMANAHIAISAVDTNIIFLVSNSKVLRSINGGVSFIDYSGSIPSVNHLGIFVDDYHSKQAVYVGNSLGVYYRDSTMTDWINYSGALPTIASIRDIMYFNDGGTDAKLYCSYFGRGVWETPIENSHTCATPQIVGTSVPGLNVSVLWNNTGATSYEIQYRPVGSFDWISATTAATSYSITSFSGCTKYEVRVRAHCINDTSLWSNRQYFTTISNPLPTYFDNHIDIGAVGASGSVCYNAQNHRYTIYASGDDIWNQQDEFHFLYKKIVGDGYISARVKHVGNIYGWAKAGVMIRETLDANSKHAMCALTPGNGFANQWRQNTSGNSENVDTAGVAPGWVKVERIGNMISAHFSTDGIVWQLMNTAIINMTDTVYVGLANCSHIDSALNDAIFDQIDINGLVLNTSTVKESATPFTIYPNPSSENLSILFKDAISSKTKFTILNHHGQIVVTKPIKDTRTLQQIDISNLASGVYFLEVKDKQRHVVKFVKE